MTTFHTSTNMSTNVSTNVGRSTRLALRATIELSSGRNVLIVAVDRDVARSIARKVCQLAKALGIPCANVAEAAGRAGRDGVGDDVDLPRVRIRGHMDELPAGPAPRNTVVLVDHTAMFERAGEWSLSGAVRTSYGLADDVTQSLPQDRAGVVL